MCVSMSPSRLIPIETSNTAGVYFSHHYLVLADRGKVTHHSHSGTRACPIFQLCPPLCSRVPFIWLIQGGKGKHGDLLGGSQGPDLEVATSFLPTFLCPNLNYKAMFNFKRG